MKKVNIEYANNFLKLKEMLKTNDKDIIFKMLYNMEKNHWGDNRISSDATSSTICSRYCFLSNINSYQSTIKTALSFGGDVDTIAKMAGSMSGAYLQISHIPKPFAKKLNDRGEYGYDFINKICEKIIFNDLENKKNILKLFN